MVSIHRFLENLKKETDELYRSHISDGVIQALRDGEFVSIQEMARLASVSMNSIRQYDRKGWLAQAGVEVKRLKPRNFRVFRSTDALKITKIKAFNMRRKKILIKQARERYSRSLKDEN